MVRRFFFTISFAISVGLALTSCGYLIDESGVKTIASNFKVVSEYKNVVIGTSITLSALGGTPPYRYTLITGTGTMNETSGVFTPSALGAMVLRATDSAGTFSDFAIDVCAALEFSPSNGKLNVSGLQSKQFQTTGGVPPYTYTVQSGSGSVNSTGLYTAPASSGTTILRVTDSLTNYKEATIENSWFRTDGPVFATHLSGGSLYIGGKFSYINATEAPGTILLDPTTGKSTSCNFKSGFGAGTGPLAMIVSGDSIYFAGTFTTYQGSVANRIAKINFTTCALDTTFSPPTNNGFNGTARALLISGNSLYVGGDFTAYKAVADSANHLAKLDLTTGAIDTTFSPVGANANGFGHSVNALAASSTALYVGGAFFAYKGVADSALKIAKLDLTTGTLDTTFSPPGANNNGFDDSVQAIVVSNASVYVGGLFTTYRNIAQSTNFIAKLDTVTGVADTTFSPPANNGFNGFVYSLAITSDSLYVGGVFTEYKGVANSANKIAKLNLTNGAIDTTFSPPGASLNGFGNLSQGDTVYTLKTSGTSLYAGGIFTGYKGIAGSANRVAKLDLTTGAIDTAFNTVLAKNVNSAVYSIAFPGDSICLGGLFTSYGGTSANNVAKLDPITFVHDTTFSPTVNGFNDEVLALASSGSSLYVGGSFTTYREVTWSAFRIAKLDLSTGAIDTTFSPAGFGSNGFNYGSVNAMLVSGTSLYVGGLFSTYKGTGASNLAKLDLTSGALDTTFSPATNGFDSYVYALATSGTSLYVGGDFNAYKGIANSANKIAKLHLTTGAIDTTFTPAGATANGFDSSVRALAISGTSLFVGGEFTTYKGIANSANRLAKLDLTSGTIDTTYSTVGATANGFDNVVRALAISGTALYVGGDFSAHKGIANSANHLAKLDLVFSNIDTTFGPAGSGANGFVGPTGGNYTPGAYSLLISGTSIYAGGNYHSYKGRSEPFLSVIHSQTGEAVY